MENKIVIVGGVGGGATVAAQIRRMDPDSEIVLFDKGEHIAFSNCGMPYYIGGIVDDRNDLLKDSTEFAKKYQINLHVNSEVIHINRSEKQITYQTNNQDYQEAYDILILSPGAHASEPNLEGLNKEVTFTLHTIPDMDRIHSFIQKNKPKTCAIIGAGFIGLEMVENLRKLHLDCTVIDRSEQVMKLIDPNMAVMIQDHLRAKEVNLILDDGVKSFTNEGKTVHLTSEKIVQADFTILAAGIRPNTQLAKEANLEIGETGAIAVNEYMQTNDPAIFALGDAVETHSLLTKTPRHVALAGPAHRQAFIIASFLHGKKVSYGGTLGSAIFKVFDLTVGATGQNAKALDHMGITYQEITHEALSHAGYYPGAEKICIKVLFDAETKAILGAQLVGKDGVDKRLAVLTTAIKGGLTVTDLAELELAYSPPYSSPKDPINIVGYKTMQ